VASLALVLMLTTAAPAHADEVASHVRAVRSDLSTNAAADRVADNSAAAIAAAGTLFHTDLSSLLGPCESAGEIIGYGPDVASVFIGFRNSAPHWSILTNPSWTAMGTGLSADSSGRVYVSVVFCEESEGSSVQPVPPSPVPAGDEGSHVSQQAPAPRIESIPGKAVDRIQGYIPAIGARRALIRAQLDDHAQAMLPDWYTGVCGKDDRGRVLDDLEANSGACPLAH
jgi:hypothetical protein